MAYYLPLTQNPGNGGSSLVSGAGGLVALSYNASCPPCAAMCGGSSPTTSTSTLTCSVQNAQVIPSTFGLLVWPALDPLNPQGVDLIIAPLAVCTEMAAGGVCNTSAVNAVVDSDGVTRYVVGTASGLRMRATAPLACS